MARFITYNNTINARGLGNLLIKEIFLKFSLPRLIVSDRGPQFTA
jgi:hypothetical protein